MGSTYADDRPAFSVADPGSSNQRQPETYKFSVDELRVLKQCNVESFYQRSLPIGSLLGVGAYYAVKAGYLKPHSRYGTIPKVCVAVIAGYFIGKFSYQSKCIDKIMALPNSQLAEILRQRKRQGISDNISLDPGFSAPLSTEVSTPTNAPRQSYLDIDSDRPYIGDYDKHSHDDVTFDVSAIPVPPGGAPATTYDELRKKNRDEFENDRNRPSRSPGEPDDLHAISRSRAAAREPPPPQGPIKAKNKYGDDWEQ